MVPGQNQFQFGSISKHQIFAPGVLMSKRNILIACEYSGIVRTAFEKEGYYPWSCDLLPSEIPSKRHYQGDVRNFVKENGLYWDLVIAFPPCTHLAVSGARYFKNKISEQKEALEFVQWFMNLKTEHVAIENPVGVISSKIRKPDQIIQPFQFGHPESKKKPVYG